MGGQGIGGLGIEADILARMVSHQLAVGVSQQLAALGCGVIPYRVWQADAILPNRYSVSWLSVR